MAIDSLKMVIEADATQAINNLNRYNATQKTVVKESSNVANQSRTTAGGFAHLKGEGEGLNLGFLKIGGAAAAIVMGLRMVNNAGRDLEERFQKLHPEFSNIAGAGAQTKIAADNLKAAWGGVIDNFLRTPRSWWKENVADPLIDVANVLNGVTEAANNMVGAGGIGRVISMTEEASQFKTIIDAVKKGGVQELIYNLIDQKTLIDEKLAHLMKVAATPTNTPLLAGLEREQRAIVQTLEKIKALQPNEEWYNFGTKPAPYPPGEVYTQVEMHPIDEFNIGAAEQANAELKALMTNLKPLVSIIPAAHKEMDKLSDSVENLGQTLANAGISAGIDVLFGLGEAGTNKVKTADEAVEDLTLSIARNLPQLLLGAGLQAIWNPNPAIQALGWTLIGAAGYTAFVGGMATGEIANTRAARAEAEKAAKEAERAAKKGGNQSVNIINVYGNVWSASDLAASTVGAAGRW